MDISEGILIAAAGMAAGVLAARWWFAGQKESPAKESNTPPAPPPAAETGAHPPVLVQRVFDALNEAVLVVKPDKTILLANVACRKFFPSAPELVGRRLPGIAIDSRLDALVTNCLADGSPADVQLQGGPTGDSLWRVDVAPLTLSGNDNRLVRLLLRDETEQARTEQIRREFVANASHELRTPLAIVHGYLESLLDGAIEDPDLARRFLKTSRRHTERMGRLIEDMLAVSKLESGDAALLRIKPFSLRKCLLRVTQHLASLTEQRQATIDMDIDPAVARWSGDRFYWEQVLFNLVENALKNNPQPGLKVRIVARPESDGGASLQVEDNGIGIPKADLPFIFKRFYRVQKDHSTDVPGTGLGLSIVKRAVEAHGASISVESQPGQRTCFTIRIPAIGIASGECGEESEDTKANP
ncbi:MAG: ATP-binding protein [Verrucomicrobiales bacterium]